MKPYHILIFPSGSEIGLEINNALKYNIHVEVYGATSRADYTQFAYAKGRYIVNERLNINHVKFIEFFKKIISEFNIDFIYPTHDSVALFLAENQSDLGAVVLTSPVETVRIAREKRKIYEKFSSYFFCPVVFSSIDGCRDFPVVVKPNKGEGGKGVRICYTTAELAEATKTNENDYILMEYLPGQELTVDCFTDRYGVLRFVGPRLRRRVEMGISFDSVSVPLSMEIQNIATSINQEVKLRGAWFFQVKADAEGHLKLLEFSARPSSTMGLYRQAGINFPLLTLFDALNMDIEIIRQNFSVALGRCLKSTYNLSVDFKHVYIDLDDTIIIRNNVSIPAIAFLYQCKNKGITVTLLTRHEYDLAETLHKYGICEHLFSDIIHIQTDQKKADFISRRDSIFIDNHFPERKMVAEKKGIAVFDTDAITGLLHEQVI